LLFPSKRIPFYNPYEEHKAGNRYDQTLFYFGDREVDFIDDLSSLGYSIINGLRKRTPEEIEDLVLYGAKK
jgi:hypothetical protein